jgi:hypothetical protein
VSQKYLSEQYVKSPSNAVDRRETHDEFWAEGEGSFHLHRMEATTRRCSLLSAPPVVASGAPYCSSLFRCVVQISTHNLGRISALPFAKRG